MIPDRPGNQALQRPRHRVPASAATAAEPTRSCAPTAPAWWSLEQNER
ncbi:MAG: hypothetical protein WKG07_06650 [Hymenobacter sp.]